MRGRDGYRDGGLGGKQHRCCKPLCYRGLTLGSGDFKQARLGKIKVKIEVDESQSSGEGYVSEECHHNKRRDSICITLRIDVVNLVYLLE